jgi:hypothetical protein
MWMTIGYTMAMDSNFEFDYDLRDYPDLVVSSEAEPSGKHPDCNIKSCIDGGCAVCKFHRHCDAIILAQKTQFTDEDARWLESMSKVFPKSGIE